MAETAVRLSSRTNVVGIATVHALEAELAGLLARARLPEARTEARDLIAAVLNRPRLWPAAHRDAPVGPAECSAAVAAARARAGGAPFAYAVGRAAFRHLTLAVDERVLIPRQETEELVEAVLECAQQGGVAVDVGTGSGAIALALATEGRFERIVATEVSLAALEVAKRNVLRLGPAVRCPVELRHGSLLAPVRELRARAVVANPPYIAAAEMPLLPRSVRDWEPPIALVGGVDGMAVTRAIIRDAAAVLEPRGLLALELDARRAADAVAAIRADGRYRDILVRRDLAGRERILLATRTMT